MKQKRKKALDGIAVACWGVGVIMVAVFLGMTAAYATCDTSVCDNGVPKCSESKFIKPDENTPPGCYKSKLIGYDMGDCTNENVLDCNTCACLPPSTRLGTSCSCRTPGGD